MTQPVSFYGLIAQQVEQTAVNRFVEGSSPSESAMFLLGCSQAVRHQTLNLAFPWFESKCPSHFSGCSSVWESSRFGIEWSKVQILLSRPSADLAQLVVQLTCNQKVAGSIPAVGTSLDFQGSISVIRIQAMGKISRVAKQRQSCVMTRISSSCLNIFDGLAIRKIKGLLFSYTVSLRFVAYTIKSVCQLLR